MPLYPSRLLKRMFIINMDNKKIKGLPAGSVHALARAFMLY